MTHFIRLTPVIAALALAACGREPEVDPELKADLDAASVGAIELAPAGAGTNVVSGVEQVRRTQVRPTAPRPRTTVTTPRSANSPDPAPTPTAQRPEPAATVPASRPAVQPPPPGGYKTVDEVIRKAPFPIKP